MGRFGNPHDIRNPTKTIETRPTNMISNTADMPTNQCLQGIG